MKNSLSLCLSLSLCFSLSLSYNSSVFSYVEVKDLDVEIVREQAAGHWEKAHELATKAKEQLEELLKTG